MPVLTKINTNSIADDAISGDKLGGSAYLANTTTQNITGTYSENRLYTSDAYTLSGNATVNGHLTLSTVKSTGDVVLTAGGAYTLTGTGVLSAGSMFKDTQRTSLTGMTGELGSAVTGANSFELVNKPSFRATHGGLSVPNNTWTGFGNNVQLNAGDCYNPSTYKFTPNVAGWYWLHTSVTIDDLGDGQTFSAAVMKNSTTVPARVRDMRPGSASGAKGVNVSTIEYANGTSDYFYFAIYQAHGSARNLIGNNYSVTMGFKLAIEPQENFPAG